MKIKRNRYSRKQTRIRNRKNTRRGGSFPPYWTYFPKRLKTYSISKLAQYAITDNSSVGLGKLGKTVGKKFFNPKNHKTISNARNETFKPEPTRYNNHLDDVKKTLQVFNPTSNVEKIYNFKDIYDKIGDVVVYPREPKKSDSMPVSPKLTNSRRSRNSNSRNSSSRNSNRNRNRNMSPNRGGP